LFAIALAALFFFAPIFTCKGLKMQFVAIMVERTKDAKSMEPCTQTLKKFGVAYEFILASAHRGLDRTREYIKEAEKKGAKVFIATSGMANHLASFVAANTTKPVIGVPMDTALDGMDALLSTVQMGPGVPVATVSIGKAGAVNSAFLAMQILALMDANLEAKLSEERILRAKKIQTDSAQVEVRLT
jgi:5-(carboxyamino)imidazole ribonucleotide mutase